ncbi:hypothetical protein AB0L65_12870 [Nonomuraea sp. NPDC052116]|uniref:hypothetical protein n=1 Tax=Nonomuraea sp. NPDC052116 TaxID=3155665 RepID=UPI00344548DD
MALGMALVAGGASAADASPALTAATVPVTFDCRADPPFESVVFATEQTITTNVPSRVRVGTAFSGSGTADPYYVPTEVNGIANRELRDFTLTMQLSGPASVTGASYSGGANLGPGIPSVTTTATTVTLKVPGPLTAGTWVTLPTITINAVAASTTGTVELRVAGTSYADPGLRVTSVVPLDPDPPIIAPSSCFPSPSPVLSSTVIYRR